MPDSEKVCKHRWLNIPSKILFFIINRFLLHDLVVNCIIHIATQT